jgi:hypothetical protein
MQSVGGGRSEARPGILGFLRSALGALRAQRPALPEIEPPRRPRPASLERWSLAVAWQARLAVRSGATLEDFLRFRLARYATGIDVPASELPVEIGVQGGEPVIRRRTAPRATSYGAAPYGARTAAERLAHALVAREGPVAAREIRDAEAEVDALDARAQAEQERLDALTRALEDDLASGALAAAPSVDASFEQLGRPPIPPAWPVVAPPAFAVALAAAVGWRLAIPWLGIADSAAGLAGAFRRDPIGLLLGLVLAGGAAASLFVLAHTAVERAIDVARESDARRRRWLAAAAGAAALVAAALAAAGAAVGTDPAPLALLLAAVPFATALLLRAGRDLAARRAAALAEALAWDRERVAETAEHARRAEAIASAADALQRTTAARASAARRVRALQARALAAMRADDEAAAAAEAHLERIADVLAAALELDRYAFVRRRANGSAERPLPRRERPPLAGGAVAVPPMAVGPVPMGAPVASAIVPVSGQVS